jgi:hypothetical protein
MDKRPNQSDVIVLLQTHGFDLLAHVEAAARCAREVQYQVSLLKSATDETVRADALYAIRHNASTLLCEHDGFCTTLREVQTLAAQLSPERRHTQQFVMWDRRRAEPIDPAVTAGA